MELKEDLMAIVVWILALGGLCYLLHLESENGDLKRRLAGERIDAQFAVATLVDHVRLMRKIFDGSEEMIALQSHHRVLIDRLATYFERSGGREEAERLLPAWSGEELLSFYEK